MDLVNGLQGKAGRGVATVVQVPVVWVVPVPAAAVPAWSAQQAAVVLVLLTPLQTQVPTWVERTVIVICPQVLQKESGIQK